MKKIFLFYKKMVIGGGGKFMVKLQVEEIISFIFLKFNPMLLDCCSVIKQQRKLIANIF